MLKHLQVLAYFSYIFDENTCVLLVLIHVSKLTFEFEIQRYANISTVVVFLQT